MGRYSRQPQRLHQVERALALRDQVWPARDGSGQVASRRIAQRLSEEQLDELVAAYLGGATSPELAKRYGIAKSTVIELLRQRGIAMRFPPITQAELALIVQLHQDGVRQVEIAERVGRSKSAVWHALRRASQLGRPPLGG